MELTKQSITNHSTLIPGIDGYLTLIYKIEENKAVNPDIAIESCKSLLEGLCLKGLSLLSDKYIGNKKLQTKCKNDLKTLTHTAFDEVYTDYVESQVHESLAQMVIDISVSKKIKELAKRKVKEQAVEAVGKVSALRNERGDISHGRIYPKTQESSVVLSKSISSITDGICSFMIEQIAEKYSIKLKTQARLIYQDLTEFNDWLDDKHHISSIKVDFSKILFENAYDKYEEFYFTEYIDLVEETEEEEPPEETAVTSQEETQEKIPETKGAEKAEVPTDAETVKPIVEQVRKLVTDFDEKTFWTDDKEQALEEFAEVENLKPGELKAVLNEYLFSEKAPLRDEVAKTMIERPKLFEFKSVVGSLTDRIIVFAKELNKPETKV